MSPNHPNNYAANSNLKIKIFVQTGKKIELTVKAFELEKNSGNDCSYDFVYIDDKDGGSILAKKCNKMLAIDSQILSLSNCIRITFKSDALNHKPGFKFEWRQVEADGKQNSSL